MIAALKRLFARPERDGNGFSKDELDLRLRIIEARLNNALRHAKDKSIHVGRQ